MKIELYHFYKHQGKGRITYFNRKHNKFAQQSQVLGSKKNSSTVPICGIGAGRERERKFGSWSVLNRAEL